MTEQLHSPPKKTILKDIFLLIAVPAAIVALAAAMVYIPRSLAAPQHDFIYTSCATFYCKTTYAAGQNVIVKTEKNTWDDTGQDSVLNYYDVQADSSKVISLEEANHYHLDGNTKSQDGYSLTRADGGGGLLFWRTNNNSWYIENGWKKKPVSLSDSTARSTNDIKLLGWINE